MLIRVLDVDAGQVRFSFPGTETVGTWRGSSPPLAGRDYLVELGVEPDLVWDGADLTTGEPGSGTLSATVQDVDATGVVHVRIGGGLAMVSVADDQRLPDLGATVVLRDVPVEVWPTEPGPEPAPVAAVDEERTVPAPPLVRRPPSWARTLLYLSVVLAVAYAFVAAGWATAAPVWATGLMTAILLSHSAGRRLARADRQSAGLLRDYPVRLDAERTGVGMWWSRATFDRSARARGVLGVDVGRASFVNVPARRGAPWEGPVERAEVVRGRLQTGLRLHGPAGTAQFGLPRADRQTFDALARWLPFDPPP